VFGDVQHCCVQHGSMLSRATDEPVWYSSLSVSDCYDIAPLSMLTGIWL
jgi:hypothetical protein